MSDVELAAEQRLDRAYAAWTERRIESLIRRVREIERSVAAEAAAREGISVEELERWATPGYEGEDEQ